MTGPVGRDSASKEPHIERGFTAIARDQQHIVFARWHCPAGGKFVLYTGASAEPDELTGLNATYDRLFNAVAPWATSGVCVNFLSGPDVTATELASGDRPAAMNRLAAIKRAVDPDDVFRIHHGRA